MTEEDKKLYEKAEARVGFKMHLRTYIIINVLIWIMWYLFGAINGDYHGFRPIYPSLGWGFGLFSHFIGVYGGADNAVEKEFQKLKKREGRD